jgi:hypothetical protein
MARIMGDPVASKAKRKAADARRYAANPEKFKAQTTAWARKNPDKVAAIVSRYQATHGVRLRAESKQKYASGPEYGRNKRANEVQNPDNYRRWRLKTSYGLTVEEHDAMIVSHGGKCAGCAVEAELRIDHDHVTGRVRGLLCHNCNVTLGLLKDSPERLEALASYLRR